MSKHTITLSLREATRDQLHQALLDAERSARRCDEQGSRGLHSWWSRAEAIRAELSARPSATQAGEGRG